MLRESEESDLRRSVHNLLVIVIGILASVSTVVGGLDVGIWCFRRKYNGDLLPFCQRLGLTMEFVKLDDCILIEKL